MRICMRAVTFELGKSLGVFWHAASLPFIIPRRSEAAAVLTWTYQSCSSPGASATVRRLC